MAIIAPWLISIELPSGASSASGGAPPAGKVCARNQSGNSLAQPPAPHADTTVSPSSPPPSEKADGVLEFDKAELEKFARDCAPAEGEWYFAADSTHESTPTVDLRDLVVRVFVASVLCALDEDLRAGGSTARRLPPPEEMIQTAAARCGSGLHLPEVRGLCGGFDHSLVCAWGWALTDLVGHRLSHMPVVSGGVRVAARALESWGYTPRELHERAVAHEWKFGVACWGDEEWESGSEGGSAVSCEGDC